MIKTWLTVINKFVQMFIHNLVISTLQIQDLFSEFRCKKNHHNPHLKDFLDESEYTNAYYYNASRVPLRIIMDYAMYGEKRSKVISDKVSSWIQNKTNR